MLVYVLTASGGEYSMKWDVIHGVYASVPSAQEAVSRLLAAINDPHFPFPGDFGPWHDLTDVNDGKPHLSATFRRSAGGGAYGFDIIGYEVDPT